MALKGTEENAKVRVLLILWDLEGHSKEVGKGDLNRCIVRTGEKASDYQPVLDLLLEKEAIVVNKEKISLSAVGVGILSEGLQEESFAFDGQQIGSRFGNALLKWIRLDGKSTVTSNMTTGSTVGEAIAEVAV